MPDHRYHAGVLAGIAKSLSNGDWPEEIPGLGPRTRAALGRCVICVEVMRRRRDPQYRLDGGWFTYGGRHYCKRHAQQASAGLQAA